MTIKSLVKEAKKLSVDERTILAHEIWSSVEEDCEDAELTEEQKRELDRRINESRQHPERGISHEDALRQLDRLYPVRLSTAQRAVLEDRLDEIDKHPERGIPWAVARKRLRRRK